jgi:hypothetical protein
MTAVISDQSSVVGKQITSADRRAVNILLSVPHHSDAFHSVLQTASGSALQQAYEKSSGGRRTAIGERLESLMAAALPRTSPSHD